MWQYHCDQLLRIVSMRRQACGADHFDFVIWMIFCIDVYALLSASGTGMFAEVVSKQNMLPLPERCLLPETDGHPQVIFPEEQAHFPRIIAVTQEIFLLALQVGRLAKVLRTEVNQKSSEGFAHVLDDTHNIERSTRIRNLRRLIFDRNTEWRSLFPGYQTWLQTPNNLPPRVLEWVEHVRYNIFTFEELTDKNSHICYSVFVYSTHIPACIQGSCTTQNPTPTPRSRHAAPKFFTLSA